MSMRYDRETAIELRQQRAPCIRRERGIEHGRETTRIEKGIAVEGLTSCMTVPGNDPARMAQ